LNVLTPRKRFSYFLITLLTLVILSACSSRQARQDRPPVLFSELQQNSTFYLNKAELADEQRNLAWQFVAVQALIAEKRSVLANSVIEYIQTQPLTEKQQSELNLLIADNLNQQEQPEKALIVLNNIDSELLSGIGLNHFLKVKIQLHISKEEHQQASDTLLLLTPLLASDEEKQQYHDLLLNELALLPIDILNQYQTTETTEQQSLPDEAPGEQQFDQPDEQQPDLVEDMGEEVIAETEKTIVADPSKQGWYALASLYQRYQLRPNQLIRSVNNWKTQYPTHPAFYLMPTQLTNLPELSPYQPENIAVLLPLSGRFKQQGHAVQYGLLHAYYEKNAEKKDKQQDEEQTNPAVVKFHFYDTQTQPMESIVSQFKELNIDFVIGPLLKNKVEELLPLAEKMPILALNSFPKEHLQEKMPATTKTANEVVTVEEKTTAEKEMATNEGSATTEAAVSVENEIEDTAEKDKLIAWHYAFPLSPEEEAKQAARLIFLQGHKRPLLLTSDSAYGRRIVNTFNEEWEKLTVEQPSTTESYYFNRKAQLAPFIARVLQTDKSKRRIAQMKMLTSLPLETKLRSRRDIDAIYIVSKRDELLMLKAFIDVSTSPFAKTIPLYASSRSHLHDQQNRELSKLTFSDIAFLLDSDNKTFKAVQQAWKKQSFPTLRLFALGFDSYQLIPHLVELQNSENNSYQGLVGQLSLDASNTIQAKLNWGKYLRGKVIEITTPAPAE
jgi:outer membrane PBP1 activator LpoA protein